jgi:hypothetical protein
MGAKRDLETMAGSHLLWSHWPKCRRAYSSCSLASAHYSFGSCVVRALESSFSTRKECPETGMLTPKQKDAEALAHDPCMSCSKAWQCYGSRRYSKSWGLQRLRARLMSWARSYANALTHDADFIVTTCFCGKMHTNS